MASDTLKSCPRCKYNAHFCILCAGAPITVALAVEYQLHMLANDDDPVNVFDMRERHGFPRYRVEIKDEA